MPSIFLPAIPGRYLAIMVTVHMSEEFREWVAANVGLIERLGRFVCRDTGMSFADIDDFVSHVMLKLVENDYAVLRKFEGRCTMSSFLIVVIRRALSDYRAQTSGRFRPSAEARRLGDTAVRLETLLRRDGRSLHEAVHILSAAGDSIDVSAAERLAARFPERSPRPQFVDLEEDAAVVEHDSSAADCTRTSEVVSSALRIAIRDLTAEDQTLLQLRFVADWSVADIARSLHVEQQRLYPRLRRLCTALRQRLIDAGIDAGRVQEIIGRSDLDLNFGLDDEKTVARPSSAREGGGLDEEKLAP